MIRVPRTLVSFLVAAVCVMLGTGDARASDIDNPSVNCTFYFDTDSDIPFLAFSSGKTATDLSSSNFFTADTDTTGDMSFDGSSMSIVPTNATVNGHTLNVRIKFSDVSGNTDLSGASPDITWTMMAKMQFDDSTDGITVTNCMTGTFEIDITGNWNDTTSSSFTIPSLSSGCNGWASTINTALGLGSSGATLTLYKFTAFNNVPQALYGS